jgi:hypothetical protein
MKKVLVFICIFVIISAGCKTKKVVTEALPSSGQAVSESKGTDFSKQETWLLGYFNPERLSGSPYSEWYEKGFDGYQPNPGVLSKLLETDKNGLSIKVVMGTWCPDSRREVPRFMKVLSLCDFPLAEVTFIGVDNAKTSPVGEYESLDIQRVPTFIIYKNKVEAGRIIENPVASLEQDLLEIVTRNEKQQ